MNTILFDWHRANGAVFCDHSGFSVPEHFGDPDAEYAVALQHAGLHDRAYRSLIEITGTDRQRWLNSFVTNEVKTPETGAGCYTFAVNNRGRLVFDADVVVKPDSIWLDVDRLNAEMTLAHLDRYHISEDVVLADRTGDFARFAAIGPSWRDALQPTMERDPRELDSRSCATLTVNDVAVCAVRNDFAGVFGLNLWVPLTNAADVWRNLAEWGGVGDIRLVGLRAVDTLRIEKGIPWWGSELTTDHLPEETGQVERAVSFTKGCYLGQEIVSRMHARGAAARRLVGLRLECARVPATPAKLRFKGNNVGVLTSACRSPYAGGVIGLGYVASAHADAPAPMEVIAGDATIPARLQLLPFRPS